MVHAVCGRTDDGRFSCTFSICAMAGRDTAYLLNCESISCGYKPVEPGVSRIKFSYPGSDAADDQLCLSTRLACPSAQVKSKLIADLSAVRDRSGSTNPAV